MEGLYERIYNACKNQGKNVYGMCRQIGISTGIISSLKSGKSKSVSMSTLQKIADYLNIPVDYFMDADKKQADRHDDLLFALFGTTEGITDEMFEDVKKYARFVLNNSKSEREGK